MNQPVERRLAAILAADVAGYSRLMGADEEFIKKLPGMSEQDYAKLVMASMAGGSSRPPATAS